MIGCALGSAILTGFGIATLTNGSTPASPVHLPAGNGVIIAPAPTSTLERRTRVLGASDSLEPAESTPAPDAIASAAASTSAPVFDIGATPNALDPTNVLTSPDVSRSPRATTQPLVADAFGSSASGWIVRDAATWSAAYTEGQYQLALHGQNDLNLSSSLPAVDYRLSVDVTVVQGGAGVVFLAAKPATFYRVMINVDGLYALQLQQQDEVIDVIPWTASAALRGTAGVAQRLHVERRGTSIQVFVNDQSLLDWSVPAGELVNQYGFAVTAQTGVARATFDNLVVEPLLQP